MGLFDKVMDDWLGDPFGSYEAEAGAKGAAQTQAAAADQGLAEQRRQYDISRQDLAPYTQAGYGAIGYNPQQAQYSQPQQSFGGGGGSGWAGAIGSILGTVQNRGGQPSQGIPQGAREKPSFGGAAMGQNMASGNYGQPNMGGGFGQGGQPSLQNFSSGYGQAQPSLNQMMGAGQGAVPQLQQYAQGGIDAFGMQQALSGAQGPEAQQAAYDQVSQDPAVTEMMRQGEEAILSNASATGGLRGGNTQGALAQFRPGILSNAINQKYNQLGGLSQIGSGMSQYLAGAGGNVASSLYSGAQNATGQLANIGQASAAGQANAAQNFGVNASNLMAEKGAALAGGQMASGSGAAGTMGVLGQLGGAYFGSGGRFGGAPKVWKDIKGVF